MTVRHGDSAEMSVPNICDLQGGDSKRGERQAWGGESGGGKEHRKARRGTGLLEEVLWHDLQIHLRKKEVTNKLTDATMDSRTEGRDGSHRQIGRSCRNDGDLKSWAKVQLRQRSRRRRMENRERRADYGER